MANKKPWKKVSRAVWRKMLAVAQTLDLEKGGLYDGRSGAINFWCSPEDRPEGWEAVEITKGALAFPRELVGGVSFDFEASTDEQIALELDMDPVARILVGKGLPPRETLSHLGQEPTEQEWEWVEAQAQALLETAENEITPLNDGIFCRFCDRHVKVGSLNDYITHLVAEHNIKASSVSIGDPMVIRTNLGPIEI